MPDVATGVPRAGNGISADATTYTFSCARCEWDTTPPRQVTADDFVREFKCSATRSRRLARLATSRARSPAWRRTAPGSPRWRGPPPRSPPSSTGIRSRASRHRRRSTLVFHLVKPAPDFPNILAMSFSSARPVEYMQYVPDSAQMRQHTLSNSQYMITKYVPGKEFQLVRNPAWSQKNGHAASRVRSTTSPSPRV